MVQSNSLFRCRRSSTARLSSWIGYVLSHGCRSRGGGCLADPRRSAAQCAAHDHYAEGSTKGHTVSRNFRRENVTLLEQDMYLLGVHVCCYDN